MFFNNISPFLLVEVCDWETQLSRIQNILETWMFVQEQWLCFEPILTTADIAWKMETEGRLFKVNWKKFQPTFYSYEKYNFQLLHV